MRKDAYRTYLLIVLLVIFAFNNVDRLALGLVLQALKKDLSLSDTQLGLFTGIAFASFYSVMGIPLARWADRGSRKTIIALTTAVWSVMVALCGVAGSFMQLLVIRAGVAIGEAGCVPPAHSLIADYFDRAERPRAIARYMLGGPISVIIGYFCAGWLNEFYGWRMTFFILALPGLGLSLLAWRTLREPRRVVATAQAPGFSFGGASASVVWMTLWRNRTFRHLLFGFSVSSFFGYGILQWQPAFFIRSFGLKTGELGTWFAVIYGLGGIFGTYLGGELASRSAANNERLQLKVIAIIYATLGAFSSLIYVSTNLYCAFALTGLITIGGTATSGPLFATIQTLVPGRMRASSIALIYLFANLIGMGLGPLAAGALSDLFRPTFGDEALRYALLALCPGYVWVGWHLWRGSKTVTADLQATQAGDLRVAVSKDNRAVSVALHEEVVSR
jgi:MFS family permease